VLANVEEVCVVVWPGDEARYAEAAGKHSGRLRLVRQLQPRGYGHAVYSAREFVGDDAFLHLVGDHLYVSCSPTPCARRLVELAQSEECSISAVQMTRESLLPYYGTVGGRQLPGRDRVYRIERVIEKPTPTEAEQRLIVSGLRAGYYLCFFGMHVLKPVVMELLERQIAGSQNGTVRLSEALDELAHREQYLAVEEVDRRYDIGGRYGLLQVQLALALSGRDRAEILTRLVELLATREMGTPAGGSER
jgi:UTP--glucose-1-phosphate uridylyltransferase